MTDLLLDTSVAVALLLVSHSAHETVNERVRDRSVALAGHALHETYAVLTRLPGDARLSAGDAARLLLERFEPAAMLDAEAMSSAPSELARHEIVGGATYDGLVALAAKTADTPLATRDRRAEATYRRLGIDVELMT
ncbi:MAG TPA: PIN domain-containing protein [Acidimicrobiales bacterium]|nr:PIN domain-containing protein [Acidimicrobiales bacterium]